MRVLVVEDQLDIAEAVRTILEREKFAVTLAFDGDAGYEALVNDEFDVVVLDLVLPKRDGFAVCRAARAAGVQTPVIMLTARDAIVDRVRGLDAGADDYLAKPFAAEELAARIRALVRRGAAPVQSRITLGGVVVDRDARQVAVGGRRIDVAATEFRLIEYLALNAGIACTRESILARVWGIDFDGSSNIVDVYVSAIRRKLEKAGARDPIATVRGLGYRFEAPSRD